MRDKWRAEGKRVVFTNGVFDLLHVGHAQYLAEARAVGDILVLGLNSDHSTRQLKGPKRPIVPQADRAELLLSLRSVDYVTIFDETTADTTLKILQPEIYVKGGDYTLSAQADTPTNPKPLPEEPTVRSYGGQIKLIPYLAGHSTSELIEKILWVYTHSN
jgi:rfaE bifunctional protein nucleotidyltransferase chain/domain